MPTKVVLMFHTFEEIKQMKGNELKYIYIYLVDLYSEFHAVKRSLSSDLVKLLSILQCDIRCFMSALTESNDHLMDSGIFAAFNFHTCSES